MMYHMEACQSDLDPDIRAIYTYGAYLDEPLHMERFVLAYSGSTRFFLHRDHNYNVVATTNEIMGVAQTVEVIEYDAYGSPSSYDPNHIFGFGGQTPKVHSRAGNPFLFTGQRQDAATGIYYYKARMMHPGLGRFLSADPLGYVDGMSLYQYVRSGPLRWLDPRGLCKTDLAGC